MASTKGFFFFFFDEYQLKECKSLGSIVKLG